MEGLADLGVETVAICTQRGAVEQAFLSLGCHVEHVPINGYLDLAAYFRIGQLLRRLKVNIVHTHMGLDSAIGLLASKYSSLPLVLSVHFDEPAYMHKPFFVRTPWRIMQVFRNLAVAHFLPVSTGVAKALSKREKVPPSKMSVIHPGVRVSKSISADERRVKRSRLGAGEQDLVISTACRFEWEKGVDIFVKAAELVLAKYPTVRFWVVGDGAKKVELESMVVERGLGERVQLLGYLSEVPELLALADIFVLASRQEPFGIAPVEAMKAGLPVISTQTSGPLDIVVDGQTGLLVPPDDVKAIADSIFYLLENPVVRTKMGNEGRRRADEHFSIERMAKEVLEVYRQCLSYSDKSQEAE